MKVVVNAVSAKMGGALAYLRNFLWTLAGTEGVDEYMVFVQSAFADEFKGLPENIQIKTNRRAERGEKERFLFDQWTLRRFAKRHGADVLFSTANFGVLYPRLPQVTSIRNPVYFSRDYYEHVSRTEGRSAVWKVAARRRLVGLSCASSRVVVTPTAAMRDMVLEWGAAEGAKCVVINHGFDLETFLSMECERDEAVEKGLAKDRGEKLLFYPSLYGKHKNFDTLVEGLSVLLERGANVRLILTCRIDAKADAYQRRTWEIMEKRRLKGNVTMLGALPYSEMPRIYAAADVVVWPSFAESFGHPLLEAMASSKPIVASDIAVNREMAGEAALYFDRFSPSGFADKVEEALGAGAAERLTGAGAARVAEFSWRRHVRAFIGVFRDLAEGKHG